jgi:hypothetical protein
MEIEVEALIEAVCGEVSELLVRLLVKLAELCKTGS